MEHLGSDIKNIKKLLSRIEKYILSKGIDSNKANDIKDFEGLGKAVWGSSQPSIHLSRIA